jgi:hypothetical protein
MDLAVGIRRVGFRKWYERQLLRSHGCLALAFVCVTGVIAAFEAARHGRGWLDQAIDIGSLLLCAGVGLWALRRYLYLLLRAEAIAHQADCPSCGTYARFDLVAASGDAVTVSCRKCARQWRIDG